MVLTSGFNYFPLRSTETYAIAKDGQSLELCLQSTIGVPVELSEATIAGNLSNSTQVVCGGTLPAGRNLLCYSLHSDKVVGELESVRYSAASVVINGGNTLWVTGGYNDLGQELDTTELLTVESNDEAAANSDFVFSPSKPGVNLVHGMSWHCLETIGNNVLILYGGEDYSKPNDPVIKDSWLLDLNHNNGWIEGPRMSNARTRSACGVIKNAGRKIVVSAGGQKFLANSGVAKDSVEFLIVDNVVDMEDAFIDSVLNQAWTSGPSMPTPLTAATSVTTSNQATLFVAGGIVFWDNAPSHLWQRVVRWTLSCNASTAH